MGNNNNNKRYNQYNHSYSNGPSFGTWQQPNYGMPRKREQTINMFYNKPKPKDPVINKQPHRFTQIHSINHNPSKPQNVSKPFKSRQRTRSHSKDDVDIMKHINNTKAFIPPSPQKTNHSPSNNVDVIHPINTR